MPIDKIETNYDLVSLYNDAIKLCREEQNYTKLLELYNDFQLGKREYTFNPETSKEYYKIHTLFMNLDKTEEWDEISNKYFRSKYGVKITKNGKESINEGKSINQELLLCNKAILDNNAQDYEMDFINNVSSLINSYGNINSNTELSYIPKMIEGIITTIKSPMGKYSLKFIHTSVKGQSSFFEEPGILDLYVKGICSRTIQKTDEILWDGNAALMKNVKFLFSNIGNKKIINEIANKGEYYQFINDQLNNEQKELFTNISDEIKYAITKTNESVNVPSNGVASIFFPITENEYILLTPVVSGDVQTALGNRKIGKRIILKRGGANPQNGGWLSKIINGRHIHFYSEIPNTLIQKNDLATSFITGRPLFKGLSLPKDKEYYNSLHAILNSIESIVNDLTKVDNNTSISKRNSDKFAQLSFRLGRIILEDFIIFAEDYDLPEEKPKRMNNTVYKALKLYNEDISLFIEFIIQELLKELTSALNQDYVNKIFRNSIENGIRSVI